MYELKRIGENWLLRRIGGRFVRLSTLKDATDVQISDNCIIADDAIYEIVEKDDGIFIVKVPEDSTKCDRNQSVVHQIKKQIPKRHCYENQAVECSSLDEEKGRKILTHNFSDEPEPGFKETKMKLEMLNKSSPKHEASLYLGSDELAEDLKSLTTESDELNEHTQSLEAGSDMVTENEEILHKEKNVPTSNNSVSERYDNLKEQHKAVGDEVSFPQDHKFIVDVISSDIAKACGLNGTVICSVENRALVFRNSITDEAIYIFPYPCIRRYGKHGEIFNFEIGRKCEYGPGTIEVCTKHARAIHSLITKIIQSKKQDQIAHPDCRQQLQFSKMNSKQ